MRFRSKFWLAGLILSALVGAWLWLKQPPKGERISLSGLKETVTVLRDEKGMAYIYAQNPEDALMVQGYVTAQDRLFQMELTRRFAEGRLSEVIGDEGRLHDIRMRTLGFYRQARKHAGLLDPPTQDYFRRYIAGINAYLKKPTPPFSLEFKAAGLKPDPWGIEDALTLMYFMSWNSSANLQTEIIAQGLVERLGPEKAREIFPLHFNPDIPPRKRGLTFSTLQPYRPIHPERDAALTAFLTSPPLRLGSNNWAVSPRLSVKGRPILANDPHLDARLLPGPWYPLGVITPQGRFVGAGIPGTPALVVGRNDDIAVGVTNSYGDMQDLYVETLDPEDPERYREGKRSRPFSRIEETLVIKDKKSPGGFRKEQVIIKASSRGPVVSGVLEGLNTRHVLTLRWAPYETMGPSLGLDKVQRARSAQEVREALREVNWIGLHFVFADRHGHIAWQTTGKLPIRSQGDSTLPTLVRDGRDNWVGWIPFEKMPHAFNPVRGWVGTCNHDHVPEGFPYYYSSHFSPSYRYRRLQEILSRPGPRTAEDHWRYQMDVVNIMAREITPFMVRALIHHPETRTIADILREWNYEDTPSSAAPTLFQSIYRNFALLVFSDELGEALTRIFLDNWYFWQERLQAMIVQGDSPWFDDQTTREVREGRDDLFLKAALKTKEELGAVLGPDPHTWKWEKVHRLEPVHPLRRKGWGKGWLGAGSHPMGGSGETLCRAVYDFNRPFSVTVSASLRMVVDLSDPDRILAVWPGGVSDRRFSPHFKDQVKPFINGEKVYWWFSDQAVRRQAKEKWEFLPEGHKFP